MDEQEHHCDSVFIWASCGSTMSISHHPPAFIELLFDKWVGAHKECKPYVVDLTNGLKATPGHIEGSTTFDAYAVQGARIEYDGSTMRMFNASGEEVNVDEGNPSESGL